MGVLGLADSVAFYWARILGPLRSHKLLFLLLFEPVSYLRFNQMKTAARLDGWVFQHGGSGFSCVFFIFFPWHRVVPLGGGRLSMHWRSSIQPAHGQVVVETHDLAPDALDPLLVEWFGPLMLLARWSAYDGWVLSSSSVGLL